jgi:medium-chain acyl-[acyl-carrier-protein] hydrolase
LQELARRPKRSAADGPAKPALSPDKQKLLALRLRQRAWLPAVEARSGKPRLFCFPYAGAGALAYRFLGDALREIAEVAPLRLPGRETRIAEQPLRDMEELVAAIEPVILPFLDVPYAFYGHSMGAAIAFELARALRRRGRRLPAALLVSAARAPQFRLNWTPPPEPSDDELIAQLRNVSGAPEEAMRLVLPALHADTALYRAYVYNPEPPLAIPIFAYAGREDPNVSVEHMLAWSEQTTAGFELREFEGGHFFIQSSGEAFLAALIRDITGQMSSTSSPRQA